MKKKCDTSICSDTAVKFIHMLQQTRLSAPCHTSLLHFAQKTVRPAETQSPCCLVSEAEKTPAFWLASPVCEGLVHYSREALGNNTGQHY